MEVMSKKEIEFSVSHAMTKFLEKQMGERAEAVTTHITGNTIMIMFKGILPPSERYMVRNQEGMHLIKELKVKLTERAKPLLGAMIEKLTGADVVDIHSDVNLATGERVEVFTLNRDIERTALKK